MKKLLVAVFGIVTIAAHAQTAEQIIENFTNAMGGLEAFQKIQTAKITGTVTAQGYDLPLTVQIVNGKGMRSDVSVMGQSIVTVFYNGKGWKVNPLQGVDTPTDIEGAELNDAKAQANLASGLMNYKNLGNSIELVDSEKVEGVMAYNIKYTAKEDGRVFNFYFSTKDFMLIKSMATREIMGQNVEVETLFKNVKEFNGLKFYTERTQSADGNVFQVIKYETVEFNVPVDEKIFNK